MAEIDKPLNISSSNLSIDSDVGRDVYDGSSLSILAAKSDHAAQLERQKQALINSTGEIANQLNDIDKILDKLSKFSNKELKNLGLSDLVKSLTSSKEALLDMDAVLDDMFDKGNADIKEFTKAFYGTNAELLTSRTIIEDICDLYDIENDKINDNTEAVKRNSKARKRQLEAELAALKKKEEEDKKRQREQNKNFFKAASEDVGKLSKKLVDLKQMMDISKLSNTIDRSSSSRIQEAIQLEYGFTRGQFHQWKNQAYQGINTSVYSAEEIQDVIAILPELNLSSQKAAELLPVLVRGQQLLGMTAETQAKLSALSNIYGKDMITYTTNRIAQYMKTDTDLSKKQLNEMTSLNASLSSELVQYGINTKESNDSLMDATKALLDAYGGSSGADQVYRNALQSVTTSYERLANDFGMQEEALLEYANSGNNLFDLIKSRAGSAANNLYQAYVSDPNVRGYWQHYSSVIDPSVAALIRLMGDAELKMGKDLSAMAAANKASREFEEAQKEAEKNKEESMSMIQKTMNELSNWVSTTFDWITMDNFMQNTIFYLSAIETTLSLLAAKSFFGGAFKAVGNGLGKGLGKLAGTPLGSKFLTSEAGKVTGLTKLGGGISLAGGLLWGGLDAYNAVQNADENYGKGHKVGAGITGFFAGGKVHKDSSGNVDYVQNIGRGTLSGVAKGTMIGAGIGSLIPVVGTAVGAGVGAIVGGLGGLFSGIWKSDKAKRQQELQEKQLEEQQKIAENTYAAAASVRNLNTITAAARMVPAYVESYRNSGDPSGPKFYASTNVHKHLYQGDPEFTGKTNSYLGPWRVSSPYGIRKDPFTGEKKMHGGIDLTAGGTQEIFAAYGGTVRHVNHGAKTGFGPYGVEIKSGNKVFQYAHMKARYVEDGQVIPAGTHIGTMGSMGNSTGQHLHYQVNVNGNHTDPFPYTIDTLWNGTPTSKSNSSSDTIVGVKTQNTPKSFVYKLDNIGDPNGTGAIVSGLSQINQTLIDLSNRQTEQEMLMNMLTRNNRQDPVF